MYPPSNEYSRLPTNNGEEISSLGTRRKVDCSIFRKRYLHLAVLVAGLIFIGPVIFHLSDAGSKLRSIRKKTPTPVSSLPWDTFDFNPETRPKWLSDPPLQKPLVLRVAVITRWDAFERRQVLRNMVYKGIKKEEVDLDFRFFVGGAPSGSVISKQQQLLDEIEIFKDLVHLTEIEDIPLRISEKRYAAVKWGGSVSNGTYDYFMTLDSDTFVRFPPLVRRIGQLYEGKGRKNVNPREEPILIGRMSQHLTYFLPRIPDGKTGEDLIVNGPWFDYPAGIGYMLSSSLVHIILSATPPLSHHIMYPSDDVMIGAWISSLNLFHDRNITYEIAGSDPSYRITPTPFTPHPVDTLIIDDVTGWHDVIGRGGHDRGIGWESVCVHHVAVEEMVAIRSRVEFLGEWEGESSE